MKNIELGCGLLAVGRQWGTTPEVPTEESTIDFLQQAYDLGIRFFDTAPSYGLSEERLGMFLAGLPTEQRVDITVATKFGEIWDETSGEARVDHSLEGMRKSVNNSLELLGHISLLQLHKTTPEILKSEEVAQAITYAHNLDIERIGVSVSDPETAQLAISDDRFTCVQFPYNQSSPTFHSAIKQAAAKGMLVIVNRPFQMGIIAANASPGQKETAMVDAYKFILEENFDGIVLTGTSNSEHLRENLSAFQIAKEAVHGN